MSITRTLALLACCVGPAAAFDFIQDDLRLGYAWSSTRETATVNGSSTSQNWDRSSRSVLDWVANPNLPLIGVLFGAGLSYDKRTKSTSAGSIDYSAVGAHVHAGAYLSLFWILRLELMPFVGVGRDDYQAPGVSSSKATVGEYGANLNLVLHLPVLPLCAGVGAGYLHSGSSQDINGTTVKLKADDITAGAFVGLSF
jgi:hypothetical protein